MKYQTVIGIDPDVDKSGVAELNPQSRILETTKLTFPLLLDFLQARKKMADTARTTLIVIVEAGWLHKANWHLRQSDSKRSASAKGNAIGRNHETGRKIVEMCKHYGITVVEQYPLKKTWQGPDGKITQKELAYFTGLEGRTNQEERDAALLAWNYAGLPVRVKCW